MTFQPADRADIASLPTAPRSALWVVVAIGAVFAAIFVGFTLFLGWMLP